MSQPLYAPADAVLVLQPLGHELRGLAPSVLSRQAVRRFLGYLHAQRERLLGRGRRSRVPSRPELVARYGYDVKYASHALRLAYQGREIAAHGRLTLPMPDREREHVLRGKRGNVPAIGEVLHDIGTLEDQIEQLLATGRTPLPAEPDLRTVSDWSTNAHRRHWNW